MSLTQRAATSLLSLCTAVGLAGCGMRATTPAAMAPVSTASPHLHGSVHGGQQPVVGATVSLYTAGTSGYGATMTNILTTTVITGPDGSFDITGDYTCNPGQQLYLEATGGDPGAGTNASVAVLAALGDCANLSSATFISMNEITTVASVFALAPFMTSATSISTSAGNTAGLARAFGSVSKLTNVATGRAPGPSLAAGAVAPLALINTLADIIAGCINSAGLVAGTVTPCSSLFNLTTAAGLVPTDTIAAALSMARNPTHNVSALYNQSSPTAPFEPQLTAAPADWAMAINYTKGGFNSPNSATVDAAGQVWFANAGNSTVTVLSQTGTPGPLLTGNGLHTPAAVAIDANGNAWIANQSANTVSAFSGSGVPLKGSPFAASGSLNAPSALAFDALGQLWVTNGGASTMTELSGTGAFLQNVILPFSSPSAIAIAPK